MLKTLARILIILAAAGLVAGIFIVLVNSGVLSSIGLPITGVPGGNGRLQPDGTLSQFSQGGNGNPSFANPSGEQPPAFNSDGNLQQNPGFQSFKDRSFPGGGEERFAGGRSDHGGGDFNRSRAVPGLLRSLGIFALVTVLVVCIQKLTQKFRRRKISEAY